MINNISFNNGNKIDLLSILSNENGNLIKLQLNKNNGYIQMINSSEFYNGYCLIRWSLKIFECFGLKKAILLDRASKICFGRNTNDEISLSLILK